MSNKLFRMVLPLTIFSLLVVGSTSCSYFSPLVGKWQDSQSQSTLEFTRDGKVILTSNGYLTSGTYELIGNDVVKFNYEGLSGGMAKLFGVDTLQYTITGNTITFVGGGGTDVYYRFGSSTTTRTNQIAPSDSSSITITCPKGGEIWHVGDTITITWTSKLLPKNTLIDINISATTHRGTVQSIAKGITNTGSYKWTIPSSVKGDSLIGNLNRIFVSCEVLTSSSIQINDISTDFTIAQ
jgi:Kre9/KNH-like N-terminal Ig-like domain